MKPFNELTADEMFVNRQVLREKVLQENELTEREIQIHTLWLSNYKPKSRIYKDTVADIVVLKNRIELNAELLRNLDSLDKEYQTEA